MPKFNKKNKYCTRGVQRNLLVLISLSLLISSSLNLYTFITKSATLGKITKSIAIQKGNPYPSTIQKVITFNGPGHIRVHQIDATGGTPIIT